MNASAPPIKRKETLIGAIRFLVARTVDGPPVVQEMGIALRELAEKYDDGQPDQFIPEGVELLGRCEIQWQGVTIKFSTMEYRILLFLWNARGEYVTNEVLDKATHSRLSFLRQEKKTARRANVRSTIRVLRRKLKKAVPNVKVILGRRLTGYAWKILDIPE